MIRAGLLLLALVNVFWYAQGVKTPALNLEAALLDISAAVGIDIANTAWKRVRA